MKNNTENDLQGIQEIFEEYLAERRKNEPSLLKEFFDSFVGEPNVSDEEILELRLNAAASPEYKRSLDNYFERRQEKLESHSNECFSLIKSTLLFVLMLSIFTFNSQYQFIRIDDPFNLVWLVILSLALVFSLLFRRSATKYKTLHARINND